MSCSGSPLPISNPVFLWNFLFLSGIFHFWVRFSVLTMQSLDWYVEKIPHNEDIEIREHPQLSPRVHCLGKALVLSLYPSHSFFPWYPERNGGQKQTCYPQWVLCLVKPSGIRPLSLWNPGPKFLLYNEVTLENVISLPRYIFWPHDSSLSWFYAVLAGILKILLDFFPWTLTSLPSPTAATRAPAVPGYKEILVIRKFGPIFHKLGKALWWGATPKFRTPLWLPPQVGPLFQ